MFTEQQLIVIRYCAEECHRQYSGPFSVYEMVDAWDYASDHYRNETSEDGRITLAFIEEIGKRVESLDNIKGFRTIPIYVGNRWDMVEKAPWDRVVPLLDLLLNSYYEDILIATHALAKTPEDQFYFEYENIHPFVDGNGRSGKILYNYLRGTLDKPVMPPNFWGSSNP